MARNPQEHPGDVAHRRWLASGLRACRIQLGINQIELGEELGIAATSVCAWETEPHPNPGIATLQRYARALDRRLDLRLTGLPVATSPSRALTIAAQDPSAADAQSRADTLDVLVASRRHAGLLLHHVGQRMGTTLQAMYDLENSTNLPRLSTYQRYARALDGRLYCRIVEAPTADPVKVDRVHAGRMPFADLTAAERVLLLRRYGAGDSPTNLVQRWRISHSTFRRVEALAGTVQAA